MVITPLVEIEDYSKALSLLIYKNFSGRNKHTLSGIDQARPLYDSLATFLEEKANGHGGHYSSSLREGRKQVPRSAPPNTIAQCTLTANIPPMKLYAHAVLTLYSDGTLLGNRNRQAIHGNLELSIGGEYERIYPQLATRLRYVSEIFFPEGMGYICGYDLVENDKIVRLGRSQHML